MIVVYLPIFTTINKQIKTIMKKKNLFLKSTSSLLAMLFVVMSAFMITSCGEDEEDPVPEPENSILEIVTSSDSHTQLEAFVNADADLAAALGGNDLTLFAPNDAAFEKLRVTLGVDDLSQVTPAVIGSVLRFHAVASVELRESFAEGTELATLQGEDISFNANGNIATGGSDTDVEFVGDEILATNGVVHVVETILIPPTIFATIGANLGKVSQTILLGADFSTLAAAIAKADTYAAETGAPSLSGILAGDNNITVFAPVNEVFDVAEITLDDFTAEQWYGLISNHVLTETVLSADLSGTYTSAAGSPITVLPSGGLDSNGWPGAEATIALADITSDNGVVHAIAGILTFPVGNPNISGTYTVTGTGCAGDGDGNCDEDGSFELPESSVEIDATTTVGLHDVSDIVFGHYLAFYTDGDVNPGQLMTNADGTISITDQDDVVYGGDVINGSGSVNEDGTIEVSISNGFGDQGDFVLTPNAGRPVTSDMISNIKKVRKK